MIGPLQLDQAVAALELALGVDFAADEGQRFIHRDRLNPLFEAAFSSRSTAELAPAFETAGVCWSRYQTLHEALSHNPALSSANPLLTTIDHPGGQYLTPGAAATLPASPRGEARPAPALGHDTDEVLATLLGLSSGEIGRLHDAGLVG